MCHFINIEEEIAIGLKDLGAEVQLQVNHDPEYELRNF